MVERHAFLCEVTDKQALASRVVVVAGVCSHAGARTARIAEGNSGRKSLLFKCAVVVVVIQLVRLRVISHKQIEPAVVFIVDESNAERFAGWVEEAGSFGDVLETTVAQVVIEPRALSLVDFRGAIGFMCSIERASLIAGQRPLDVVGDEKI